MGKRKYIEENENDACHHPKQAKEDKDQNKTSKMENVQIKKNVFDVKHFRKELSSKTGQTIALTQFLQACTNSEAETDYLLQYLNNGGNAHEILRQIGTDNKKNLTLATPAFNLLHLIITKVQSELPQLVSITEEACRYFLNTYIPTVEIMIGEHSGQKHRLIVLKLLTSMVSLNPELGIEILNQVPLTSRNLQYLMEKKKETDNTRSAYIHLITSFLYDGHVPLIKSFLEKQGLFSLVLPELVNEDGETVIMFLDIVEKNILNNQHISKSLKLRTFSHQVIHNMFRLFYWKGPPNVANEKRQHLQMSITETTRRILFILFTSNKNGLYFLDDKLGTGDIVKNPNLCKALESLKRPWENENVCNLILSILNECPDLYRSAISVIEQSFDPQHSMIWKKTVDFTIRLISNLDQGKLVKRFYHLSPTQVTNLIRFTSLPVPLLKYIYQSTSMNDIALINECILLLVQMLLSIKSYLHSLKDSHAHIISLVKNRLETFLPKHLPASETLVKLLRNLQLGKFVSKPNNNDYKLPVPHITRSMINLLDTLLLYCELQPSLLENVIGEINVKELLHFCDQLKDGEILQLKFKIVSLLLHFDKYAISTEEVSFKDIVTIMLDVYIKGDVKSATEAKSVLSTFLKSTKIFEGDEEEIAIILYGLKMIKAPDLSELIVQVLENSMANITELKIKISQLYSENDINLNNNVDKLLSALKSMPNKNNFINIQSNIIENLPSTYNTITPFLLELLKLFSQLNKPNGDFAKFVQHQIVLFMHYTLNPEVMYKIISSYKLDVKSYIKTWLKKPTHLNASIFSEESFLYKIDNALFSSDDYKMEDIFPVSESLTDYFSFNNKFTLEDEYEIVIWANLIRYHTIQLLKLKALDEKKMNEIKKFIVFVVKLSKSINSYKENTCRKIVSKTLANVVLQSLFSFDKCGEGLVTLRDFLVFFIPLCYEVCSSCYVDNLCKPYRHMIFTQLHSELMKMDAENINYTSKQFEEVVSVIQLELKQSLEIMLTICDMKISCLFTEKNEPALPLYVATKILDAFKNIHNIPDNVTSHIFKLYIKILNMCTSNHNIMAFEESLLIFLETHPENILLLTENEFECIFKLKVIKKTTSQMFAMFLKYNAALIGILKKNFANPETLTRREIALPLANAACTHSNFVSDNASILFALYKEYSSNIYKMLEKPQKVGIIYENNWRLIKTLILECMDVSDCDKFFNKIHKFDSLENYHYKLIHAVFLKTINLSKNNKMEFFINYILILLNMLNTNLQSDNTKLDALTDVAHLIDEAFTIGQSLKILDKHQTEGINKIMDNSTWQNFCKVVLKSSLRVSTINDDKHFYSLGLILLNLLTNLIILIYPKNHQELATLFEMATSHSEFLNVMLSNHSKDVKYQLLKLLYVLLLQNTSVMKSQHIPVYLSSYHATQSKNDQLLFKILHLYHLNGQPMHEFKPYLWGDAASNFYSVRKKRSKSLWGHPTPNQIINLFDKEVIEKTVELFPIFQKLNFESENYFDLYEPLTENKNVSTIEMLNEMNEDGLLNMKARNGNSDFKLNMEEEFRRKMQLIKCTKILITKFHGEIKNRSYRLECHDNLKIYDPAFLLSILSHILAPGNIVSCFKIVRSGLLAIPIMALSSSCPSMRAAGYHVLHRFYLQLETETRHKNDKLLLNDFFETLKRSLSSVTLSSPSTEPANPRLPTVIATYLSRALMVLTASFHPLYKPVNNFLIAKDKVDFTFVPDFLSLFHDNDIEYIDRRLWILEVMSDGLKSANDASLLFKSMSLKLILSLYSTVLSDKKTKETILKLLCSIFALPRATEILLPSYSVLPWMTQVFSKFNYNESNLVSVSINLLSNIWYSNTINQINKSLTHRKGDISSISFSEIEVLRPMNSIDLKIFSLMEILLPQLDGLSVNDLNCYLNLLHKFPVDYIKQLSDNHISALIKHCFCLFKNEDLERILLRNIIMKSEIELLMLRESLHIYENKNEKNENEVLNIKHLVEILIKKCN